MLWYFLYEGHGIFAKSKGCSGKMQIFTKNELPEEKSLIYTFSVSCLNLYPYTAM